MIVTVVDWVVDRVEDWGYLGIFLMMFVESSFVPFPSEVAMVPAGYLVSQGKMDAVMATGAGIAGSLGGAFMNYFLSLYLGLPLLKRVGHVVGLHDSQFDRAERYFAEHGEITTFVSRLIPGVRQLISVPAGLARMNLARFALFTGLGAGIWSAILIAIGYAAGEFQDTWRALLREATLGLIPVVVMLVVVYVWWHRRPGKRELP